MTQKRSFWFANIQSGGILTPQPFQHQRWLLLSSSFAAFSITVHISGEGMVVSQSLGLLITDSISFLMALSASQLHSSPTMFNPPSTPQRTPHPLLRAELDMNMSSLAQKVVGRSLYPSVLGSANNTHSLPNMPTCSM